MLGIHFLANPSDLLCFWMPSLNSEWSANPRCLAWGIFNPWTQILCIFVMSKVISTKQSEICDPWVWGPSPRVGLIGCVVKVYKFNLNMQQCEEWKWSGSAFQNCKTCDPFGQGFKPFGRGYMTKLLRMNYIFENLHYIFSPISANLLQLMRVIK